MTRRAALAGDDVLAGCTRVGNVKNNDPEPDPPDRSAMNLLRWLAALSAILTLAACAQVTADQGQAPHAPYPLGNSGEYPRDRGGDGGGGGGGSGM
jgi:hypothetical protein